MTLPAPQPAPGPESPPTSVPDLCRRSSCADRVSDLPLTAEELARTEPMDSGTSLAGRLNWLRAAVLGANDGIVSIAGLVVGVAGATSSAATLLVAGLAGTIAGALSMAGGEYVSVSTQRDTEAAAIARLRADLAADPRGQLIRLTSLLRGQGISPRLSSVVALEMTEQNALEAHARLELGMSSRQLTNPWVAAGASMLSFSVGAAIPLLLMVLSPAPVRVAATGLGVALALTLTGWTSATLGDSPRPRAILRNVAMGLVGMAITHLAGRLVAI